MNIGQAAYEEHCKLNGTIAEPEWDQLAWRVREHWRRIELVTVATWLAELLPRGIVNGITDLLEASE